MSFKKLGMVLLALVAFGAIAASSALAKENFEASKSAWYTGASPGTKLTGTKVLKSAIASPTLVLNTTVSGKALKLEATGVECVGCTIENSGEKALAHGKLKFTGITYIEPEKTNCSTPATNETKALTASVGMIKGSTKAAIKFVPTEGETFTTVEITGASCSIKGTYKVTGTAFAEAANATNVFAKKQKIIVSKTVQENLGTETSLKFGANPAFLTGEVNNFLEGEPEFATKES